MAVIPQYFVEKRGRANGITNTAGTLGVIVLSPLIPILIRVFSFQGFLILYGGIFLHTLVFASLLRPIEFYRISYNDCKKENQVSNDDKVSTHTSICYISSVSECKTTTISSDISTEPNKTILNKQTLNGSGTVVVPTTLEDEI